MLVVAVRRRTRAHLHRDTFDHSVIWILIWSATPWRHEAEKILALSGGQGQNLTNYGHSTGQGTHGPVLQVIAAYSD